MQWKLFAPKIDNAISWIDQAFNVRRGHFAAPGVSILKVSFLVSCRSINQMIVLLPARNRYWDKSSGMI